MKFFNKKPRLSFSIKPIKANTGCNKCNKTPSNVNCLKCILNLHNKFSINSDDEHKYTKEQQIAKLAKDLDELDQVPRLFVQVYDAISEKKRKLEMELKLESELEGNNAESTPSSIGTNSTNETKKIPIAGFKNVIAKKIGKFFFSLSDNSGLHLSKIHEDEIVEFTYDHFVHSDGKAFSMRSLKDHINIGGNMEPDDDFGS